MKLIYIFIFLLIFINIFKLYNSLNHIDVKLIKFPNYVKRKYNTISSYNNIPLVIYQTWHSHTIPINMANCIYKLTNYNPEFDYYLYSEVECELFIKNNFNIDVVNAFNTLIPGAYKSDLWRYCILYIKGGVYLDIKFYSNVKILSLIQNNSILFVKDISWCNYSIYNAFMISPPNNIIFKYCIDNIVNSCKFKLYKNNSLDITGPCLLGRMFSKYFPDKYNNYVKNFKWNGNNIVDGDTILFTPYPEYRDDQKKSQKNKHYHELWNEKNVYY
jgi:mannosyltransferase OCH1-like enzyme